MLLIKIRKAREGQVTVNVKNTFNKLKTLSKHTLLVNDYCCYFSLGANIIIYQMVRKLELEVLETAPGDQGPNDGCSAAQPGVITFLALASHCLLIK